MAEEDLDDIVEKEAPPVAAPLRRPLHSVDDVLQNSPPEGIEKEAATPPKPSFFSSFFYNSLGVGVGTAASALLFGAPLSALYMAGAFGLGNIIEKIRGKEKWNWHEFLKDLSTGALLSPLGLGIYSSVDIVDNSSLLGKIARVGIFAGPAAASYIYLNRMFLYFRDKVGLGKTFRSIQDGSIATYLKKAHQEEGKPNILPGIKTAFLNFAPIWSYTLNYLKDPSARLLIGNVNDVLYRLLISGKNIKSEVIWNYPVNLAKKVINSVEKSYHKFADYMRGYTSKYIAPAH